jgi:hypothetical protein
MSAAVSHPDTSAEVAALETNERPAGRLIDAEIADLRIIYEQGQRAVERRLAQLTETEDRIVRLLIVATDCTSTSNARCASRSQRCD